MVTLAELGLPKSLIELPAPCQAAMSDLLETATTIPSGEQPPINRTDSDAVLKAGALNGRIIEFLRKSGGRRDPLQALESYAEQASRKARELGRTGMTNLNMKIHERLDAKHDEKGTLRMMLFSYATTLAIVADQPEFSDNIPLDILKLYAMGGYDGNGQTELQIAA